MSTVKVITGTILLAFLMVGVIVAVDNKIANSAENSGFVVWKPPLSVTVIPSGPPRPRFEKIYLEKTNINEDYVEYFEVWYDKESGQEIVCPIGSPITRGGRSTNCYPTGRKW